MSMNEFEQEPNKENYAILPQSGTEQEFPPDFEEEDLVFAHELNSIFSPEQEELPPYFVQTLLASEDQLFNPVEPGFEHKTRAQVFRRLKLRRRLFHAPRSAYDAFTSGLGSIYARGSLLITAFVFMLIMAITVAFTAPSFATGMAILLQGAHSGVYQVNTYPKSVHIFTRKHGLARNNVDDEYRQITLFETQQQLHFKIYMPTSLPPNYALNSIYIYQKADQSWTDGPFIKLVYNLNGVKSKGTGQIVIREFLPNEDVLQVVQDKAVHLIQVDKYGQPAAIYINGQWQAISRIQHKWVYGGRSELIYQQNGILFWIAGDQHDGIGEKELWNLAQSFRTNSFSRYILMRSEMPSVTQVYFGEVLDPQELVNVYPDDNPGSAYYFSVGSDQPTTPIPTQIGGHSH